MAMANLVMPRLPDHQASPFYQPQPSHRRSVSYQAPRVPQQPPPLTSSDNISPLSTSNSTSPTSPKNYHTRQLRPLYMPAVLRPNEYPSNSPPAKTPPRIEDEDDDDRPRRSSTSFISLSGLSGLVGLANIGSKLSLSRKSTADSAKCLDWNWDLSNFPVVNGEPTRKHWKPDSESSVCDDPTCKNHFNYVVRRHHCRRCGNIFCDWHARYSVPLDESANFNPRGEASRACFHCYNEFKSFRTRTNSQSSSVYSATAQNTNGNKTAPTTPLTASPTSINGSPSAIKSKPAEVALSVPRDWNWSTF